jgi:hypothetical protein
VLVCGDLSPAQQMCQAVHAAHESGIHLAAKSNGISSVVVCSVPAEDDILKADFDLKNRGIRSVVFREPDLGDKATALATEPLDKDSRKFLSRYPLWKGA